MFDMQLAWRTRIIHRIFVESSKLKLERDGDNIKMTLKEEYEEDTNRIELTQD